MLPGVDLIGIAPAFVVPKYTRSQTRDSILNSQL